MAHRTILTARQRKRLLDLPDDESTMLAHYVLSNDDIFHINRTRSDHNRIGFSLQLCALRYPGHYLNADDIYSKN